MSKTAQDQTEVQDDRVLEMRKEGKSFATIAKSVGYTHATEAPIAFNRALRRRPAKEQAALGKAELARLDALEKKVRNDAALTEDDTTRRLKAVAKLRALTLAP